MRAGMLVPEPLKQGDVLGVIAPAGQIYDRERFENGIRLLREMGFAPRFPRSMWPGGGYLSDRDDCRADEFLRMVDDPEVKGIIAARGGYGCLRMLRHADLEHFGKHPKVFIGFSDITILLNRIALQANVVTFHGPVVTSLATSGKESQERFYHALTGDWRRAIAPAGLEILRAAESAEGPLIGGNLSTLTTLLGTGYDFSYDHSILFLEDVNEPLYKIDRMLTQLALAGKFERLNGVVMGEFTFDSDFNRIELQRYRESIWTRVLELTAANNAAVWANFPVGHAANNLTLPVGTTAVMDCKKGSLRFP